MTKMYSEYRYPDYAFRRCTSVFLLLILSAGIAICEAQEQGTKSIFGNFFGRWFSFSKLEIDLMHTSVTGTSNAEFTATVPIRNGDIISRSKILNMNDITVRIQTMPLFVNGVSIKYMYRDDLSSLEASEQRTSYDESKPYTMLAESTNDITTLQLVGQHRITTTVVRWFGIQGRSQAMDWNVVDDVEFPIASPISVSSPTSVGSPVNVPTTQNTAEVIGELQIWHKITIVFRNGPSTSETAAPNPFTDFRLDVTFRNENTDTVMTVPGYYAADGKAQHTSATSGRVWHCHFAPTEIGIWSWQASFLTARNVAMSSPRNVTGATVSPIHGAAGLFSVQPSNKTGVDLRGKGMLQYVEGKHHLQFAGTGEWFLKAGADSPENFLAYNDFDNTPDNGQRRKSWSKHLIDFVPTDPTWAVGKGKGIIGAINYLSAQGMRAFSFLTMNINGDDNNVYPYVNPSDRLRFDVSKLAQWEAVFEHGTKKGMFLHFKTQERENDQLLDQGNLGNERKLYYRELIARFGHHLALNWNIGEENTNTLEQEKEFADWFKVLDPYKHPVVIHTWPTEQELVYGPLYGHRSYDGASIQTDTQNVFQDTLARIQESVAAGRTWVVSNDEQGGAATGVVPDATDPNHNSIRRDVLWGNIMAGGAGVEYYFGYNYENSDLTCEDYRSRANMWVQSRYALEFFAINNIPFQDMVNANSIVTNNNWCLMERSVGRVIVVYLRRGGTASINLAGLGGNISNESTLSVRWYDPQNGGGLQSGSVTSMRFPNSFQPLGIAPTNNQNDWVVLLRCIVGC